MHFSQMINDMILIARDRSYNVMYSYEYIMIYLTVNLLLINIMSIFEVMLMLPSLSKSVLNSLMVSSETISGI